MPGVGKKTAQKILLQLQDRLPALSGLETIAAISDVDTEVLDALTALGYSVVEAQAALQSIPRDTPPGFRDSYPPGITILYITQGFIYPFSSYLQEAIRFV